MPLACLQREWPNKLDHVMASAADVASPRALHPAFYGCFDWHSAVHGHWMLARLVRVLPALPEAGAIGALFDATLTAEHLAAEVAYFARPEAVTFERPYGWGWLLALAGELAGTRWEAAVAPLARVVVERFTAFLPKLRYPVRTGVHANTAFAMALALDYAAHDRAFADLLADRALAYFGDDRDHDARHEPSGEDFLSPALVEADLMRRVLGDRFAGWLGAFWPRGLPAALATPAIASADRSDPKLAHLDGLNLSRAWCLRALAGALAAGEPLQLACAAAAEAHARVGLTNVTTGDYAGEHWLATFATYLTSAGGPGAGTA